MNKSESITHLATALARAQAEMPVAIFDAANPFLKTKYASLGSVIQASRPILAKHKLSLVQFPIGHGNAEGRDGIRHLTPAQWLPKPTTSQAPNSGLPLRDTWSPIEAEREKARNGADYIGVESILTHESGEFIAERIVIPLVEEKGKSRVQSAGSTLTYLRRYSWAAILGMYADEDADGASPVQAFTQQSPPTASPTLPPVPRKQQQ